MTKYVTLFDGDTIDGRTYALGDIVEKLDPATAHFLTTDQVRIAVASPEDVRRAADRKAENARSKADAARDEAERLAEEFERDVRDAGRDFEARKEAVEAAHRRADELSEAADKSDDAAARAAEEEDKRQSGQPGGQRDNDEPVERWNKDKLLAEMERLKLPVEDKMTNAKMIEAIKAKQAEDAKASE